MLTRKEHKKVKKRLLSATMIMILLIGTILPSIGTIKCVEAKENTTGKPGIATVPVANEQGYYPMYKIQFDAALMEASTVHSGFPWSMPGKEYDCMTSPTGEKIVSEGYANIITYTAQQSGALTFKNATVNFWGGSQTVLFAITDKEGNILYPEDKTMAVLNKENKKISGTLLKGYEVEPGDEINFIFEGVSGKTTSIGLTGILVNIDSEGKETRLTHTNGQFYPTSGSKEQGASGFSYRYAKTFANEQIGYAGLEEEKLPGTATIPVANEQGYYPMYKIQFDAALMEESTVSGFPWSMPGKEYDCMTSPTGEKIVSEGYANIVTYTAQQSGTLVLKNASVQFWGGSQTVLFAITDKEGNILYPEDKTMAVLNKENKKISGTLLKGYEVEPGDEINFIFEGVSGKTASIGLMGILVSIDANGKETRLTHTNGHVYPASGSKDQGASGFSYRYAKTFSNEQIGYAEPEVEELPGTATIPVANEQGYYPMYKIQFDAALMEASTVSGFPWSMPGKEYDCMTSPTGEKIVSEGYANIVTYTAQQSGTLVFKNASVQFWGGSQTVLFAITDKEGNILYPQDGTMAVLNKENKTISGTLLKGYKVNKGDEINFIFEGVSGKTASIGLMGILVNIDANGKETRLTHTNGQVYPASGSREQGASGFSYRYAKTFANEQIGYAEPKIEVLPGKATIPQKNAEGKIPTYKIQFDAALMEASFVRPEFPWSMPDKENDCMTNPTGEKIVSEGYANIITYTAQQSGTLVFKNASVQFWGGSQTVLFAITDKEGNILYPKDGTMAVLNKENKKISGTLLKGYQVNKGDEINFIFEGASGKTASIGLMGILVNIDAKGKETRLTHKNGQFYPINGGKEQGASGFSYRYAKTFANEQIGYAEPKVEVLPGKATIPQKNAEGKVPTYKIQFEAALMETSYPGSPWSMPDREDHCMTNPVGEKIVSEGYANIVTYKAQQSGTLTFKNAAIQFWGGSQTVLFAITDKKGNILYPKDGTMAVLNKENKKISGTLLANYEVKKGDEINFIFEGASGKTASIGLMGILVYKDAKGKETRLTHTNGHVYPTSGSREQGASGFYYRYAKSFKNIITGYVKPRDLTIRLETATEVKVSDNPEDFANYQSTNKVQTPEVEMFKIMKEDIILRHKWIPISLIGIFALAFGSRWMLFIKNVKKETRGGKDEKIN